MFFSLLPTVVLLLILLPALFVQKKEELEREADSSLMQDFDDFVATLADIEQEARLIASDSRFFAEVTRVVTDNNVSEYERILFRSQTLPVLQRAMSINGVRAARMHIEYPCGGNILLISIGWTGRKTACGIQRGTGSV